MTRPDHEGARDNTSDGRPIRLGLIGDNIAHSRAPRLHEVAGDLTGLRVRYDRLIPPAMGMSLEAVFRQALQTGYRGLNITYPYKEAVLPLVTVPDSRVARLGAVNTVLFNDRGPEGHNTDWSGFIAAYRHGFGMRPAGEVCIIGAGGVGKAVAFGLLELAMTGLRLVDRDMPKADALATALRAADPTLDIRVTDDVTRGAAGAGGLVNCTPVGMVGHGGTPVPAPLLSGATWAFDAVYTPVNTQFLIEARTRGLSVLSGEELFFYQGLHAYEVFHGAAVDEGLLRGAIGKGLI